MFDNDTRPPSPDPTVDPDEEGTVLHVVVAFCADLPERTGESFPLQDVGIEYVLGRGVAGTDEIPVEFASWHPVVRRSPRELAIDTISRRHLQLIARPIGVEVRLLGRGPMRLAGKPATEGIVPPGETILVEDRLLLFVTRRPLTSVLRHFPLPLLGAPGQPDAFGMIGDSWAMMRARDAAAHAALGDGHTLVTGPSGAGKEAMAHAVHGLSSRASGPFITFNAAGLTEELAQAELFGNEKNFPNPPMEARPGLVAEANQGTLYFDEIGDMLREVQAKLLRVLDSRGEYRRLGGKTTLTTDLRVVGATNQPLQEFRPEFLGRFTGRVEVPSLRERPDDVPLIAQKCARKMLEAAPHLAERFLETRPDGSSHVRIAPDMLEVLMRTGHPLNVRGLKTELWAAMRRSVGSWIRPSREQRESLKPPPPARSPFLLPDGKMRELTAADIRELRELYDGSRGSAARIAEAWGVSRYQVHRLLKRYGIEERELDEGDGAP